MKNILYFDFDISIKSFNLELRAVLESSELKLQLDKSIYNPIIGDTLYILPGVNIPRVKLNKYCTENHIKVTRDVTKANIIFGSNKTIEKMTDFSWQYIVPINNFKNCITALIEQKYLDEYQIAKLDDSLEVYDYDYVLTNWKSVQHLGDESLYRDYVLNHGAVLKRDSDSSRGIHILSSEEYSELYTKIENKTILDESSILTNLNGSDAILINKEVYQQICSMLDSSDTDNHILAMELMANSNYKDSLYYLVNLFKKYNSHFMNSPTLNHVNFKSLLSYLGVTKHTMRLTLDDMVGILLKKDVLTPGMLKALAKEYLFDCSSGFYSSMFQIKEITVNKEILQFLNSNFTFELLEDFIPKQEDDQAKEAPEENITPVWT